MWPLRRGSLPALGESGGPWPLARLWLSSGLLCTLTATVGLPVVLVVWQSLMVWSAPRVFCTSSCRGRLLADLVAMACCCGGAAVGIALAAVVLDGASVAEAAPCSVQGPTRGGLRGAGRRRARRCGGGQVRRRRDVLLAPLRVRSAGVAPLALPLSARLCWCSWWSGGWLPVRFFMGCTGSGSACASGATSHGSIRGSFSLVWLARR